jgi:hypothetical protein
MVLILFVCFFRLDELIVKPKGSASRKPRPSERRFSGIDKDGHSVLLEPDGHSDHAPFTQR